MTDAIDWNGELEAYHPDEITRDAKVVRQVDSRTPYCAHIDEYGELWFRADGSAPLSEWRIRNRTQQSTLPEGVTPELVKRMLANTKSLATAIMCNAHGQQAEAKAILAEYEAATKTDPLVEVFKDWSERFGSAHACGPERRSALLRTVLEEHGLTITQAPK